ncbi:MAG: YraN family protein [Minisyncoccia bacterium]
MAKHNEIGKLGEKLATKWLTDKGYSIVTQNYLKKYGEIDIVARETDVIHFVEVKSVSYETKADMEDAVSRGTWRPEENVHFAKQQRLSRVIEVWLSENIYKGEWQIDILSVRIVPRERIARFYLLDNVIFE